MKEILQKKNLNSAKHKRGGNKKSKKCEECDLEFFSHWNLKHHKLVTHSTKEEREKQKYSPSEIKAYAVGDKVYNSIPFSGGLFAKPLSFLLVIKPGRIYEYAYYYVKSKCIRKP